MCPHDGELALGFAALGVGIICADGEKSQYNVWVALRLQ